MINFEHRITDHYEFMKKLINSSKTFNDPERRILVSIYIAYIEDLYKKYSLSTVETKRRPTEVKIQKTESLYNDYIEKRENIKHQIIIEKLFDI